jgi:hypothetical protein
MKKYSGRVNTSVLRKTLSLAAALVIGAGLRAGQADNSEGPGGPVFPNDFGPTRIDVARYPERIQADYPVFVQRCSQCHTIARAISSQYLQLTPKQQKAAQAREPEIFQDDKIWHINDSVWSGYVQHMHEKAGASLRHYPADIDQITEFLIYDSKARKTGVRRETWRAARQKLLDDFKTSDPKRYAEIFGQ